MPLGMATSCRPGSPHPTATRWHRMSHAHAHTHTPPHTHTCIQSDTCIDTASGMSAISPPTQT